MSIFQTVKDVLQASSSATATDDSEGAYWCHDCNERIRDVDVEGEGTPTCPNCDEEMEFERSKGTSSCAC